MIFTRDFVTRENHWQTTPLVTKKSLFTVTHALFFISFKLSKKESHYICIVFAHWLRLFVTLILQRRTLDTFYYKCNVHFFLSLTETLLSMTWVGIRMWISWSIWITWIICRFMTTADSSIIGCTAENVSVCLSGTTPGLYVPGQRKSYHQITTMRYLSGHMTW